MGARRTARERALQALFLIDQDPSASPVQALDAAWAAGEEEEGGEPREAQAHDFALVLVQGVKAHQPELDALIESHSHHWRLERMARVDRNILRLGAFELKHLDDVPRKVTLNEAVELGKTFGSEDSGAFVNGLLDKLAATLGKP